MQINIKTDNLQQIDRALPISSLNKFQTEDLQRSLAIFGYPVGEIDGLLGRKTKSAWAEFKTDIYQGNPDLIGTGSIQVIVDKLTAIKERDYEFTSIESTIEAIKKECYLQDIKSKAQIAYILATTQWETAQTFEPVREAFWYSENWRKNNLRYYPFYGRGFVQLTWKDNYLDYFLLLGIDLVKNPDLALDPYIAIFILVHGFKVGAFTGRKITDYINGNKNDFILCRRCINGNDKAVEIANLAKNYLDIL